MRYYFNGNDKDILFQNGVDINVLNALEYILFHHENEVDYSSIYRSPFAIYIQSILFHLSNHYKSSYYNIPQEGDKNNHNDTKLKREE